MGKRSARSAETFCVVGFGFGGALPPAARLRRPLPPPASRGLASLGQRHTTICVVGFVYRGALPPAARFATAPPAAFGGLASLGLRESAGASFPRGRERPRRPAATSPPLGAWGMGGIPHSQSA